MLNRQPYRSPRKKRISKKQKRKMVLVFGVILLFMIGIIFWLFFGNRSTGNVPGEPPVGPPYIVALDAGHGGDDVGAIGIIQEIDLTQQTVGMLYDIMMQDPNYTPVLCRKLDEGASISERVKKANKKDAVLLLSVHGNADDTGTARGFECFPAPPGRKWHEESFRFAQILGEEMEGAGSLLRGIGGVRYVYYNTGLIGASKKVFHEITDGEIYDKPSFGIVDSPDCPAVLAEQCFITNPEDVAGFASEEGCQRAAMAYYYSICRYFDTVPVV